MSCFLDASNSAASASRWRWAAAILVASHSSRGGSMMVVCDRRFRAETPCLVSQTKWWPMAPARADR